MNTLLAVTLGYCIPGFAIALGLMLIVSRLGRKRALWLLGHPLIIEITGLCIAWYMHGGTIVGSLAVVVAGICIFLTINIGRWCFGYIRKGHYTPGNWFQYDPETLK